MTLRNVRLFVTRFMNLKEQLDERKSAFNEKASDYIKKIYQEGIDSVENQGVLGHALNVGDKAPDFTLKNALGENVYLYETLKDNSVILTWYRGGWCPYCNLTLQQLQRSVDAFAAAGAKLLALTPEVPDKSLSTKEKNDLNFEVLSDIDNKVAEHYKIVFDLTDEVGKQYEEAFGLSKYNGNEENKLPLAATYLIDQKGIIQYAFLDKDYRNRAEPADILEALKKMSK